jgi:hypothetical protein
VEKTANYRWPLLGCPLRPLMFIRSIWIGERGLVKALARTPISTSDDHPHKNGASCDSGGARASLDTARLAAWWKGGVALRQPQPPTFVVA